MNTHHVILRTACSCERKLEFEWPGKGPPEFLTVVLDSRPPMVLAKTEVPGSVPQEERREFKGSGISFSGSKPLKSFPDSEPTFRYEEIRS